MASNKAEGVRFIGVERVMQDWGVSRSKAYQIIRDMNKQIKAYKPSAITMAGKVNRIWYEKACLISNDYGKTTD